jgi:hypothetical protein
MKEKLKIGVLLNSHLVPSWEYRVLKVLSDSDYAEIALVIYCDEFEVVEKNEKKPAHQLLRLLERTDRIIFSSKTNFDLKKDIAGLLNNVASITDRQVDKLADFNLDLILTFGSCNINHDILKNVKYGILSYSVNNETGFWEVLRKIDVTNSVLLISEPGSDKQSVIFSSWESTCPFSISINRNNVHWRNSLFMPRIIKGIYDGGHEFVERQKNIYKILTTEPQISTQSSSKSDLAYVFDYAGISLRTIFRKLFYTDDFNWQLLIDINQNNDVAVPDFSKFRKVISPKGVFWADPFVVKENDYYYLFVEEYIYKKLKAHISVLKVDNKGNLLSANKIIERQYHMSYPFVFTLDNDYYMIPETGKNKTIELYKSTGFPYKWEFERNLMENISAVDTTLFFYNNKWWLFTSVDQTGNVSGNSTELFLYFTDNIFSGKWEYHPENPIVSDVRSARPAGKLYIHDGIIYRPSQDCSGRYGKAFNINKVTKLTETEYSEAVHVKINPGWDKKLAGTHTYNCDADFSIIDTYTFRKRVEDF